MSKINLDDGYFFGIGLFETILVNNRLPEYINDHIKRINNSIEILGLNIKRLSKNEIIKFIKDNEEIFENKKMVLKINLSEKNRIFSYRDFTYTKKMYEEGFKIKISKIKKSKTSKIIFHKTNNYAENIFELKKSKKENYNEVLFLNECNEITECATSNIFFVRENKIYTPTLKCGLLNGIIRQKIIKKYSAIETKIKFQDIKKYDFAFITNSIMGIMPIRSIENIIFNDLKFDIRL